MMNFLSMLWPSSKKKDREQYNRMSEPELRQKSLQRQKSLSKDFDALSPSEFRKQKSVVGLDNIGNTCYINSAIQCLNHCEDLTNFILTGAWKTQVNAVNPLGTEGELLVAYVSLIQKLWSTKTSSSVYPADFKDRLEKENSCVGKVYISSKEILSMMHKSSSLICLINFMKT